MPPWKTNWLIYMTIVGLFIIVICLAATKAPKTFVRQQDNMLLDVANKKIDTVIYGQRLILLYLQNDTGRTRQFKTGD